MAIEVKRQDYPARTDRAGNTIPAHFECYYMADGKQIAHYTSRNDTLYLRTDYIGTEWSKSPYERALECSHREDYKYLFAMLGADGTTKMSEYT